MSNESSLSLSAGKENETRSDKKKVYLGQIGGSEGIRKKTVMGSVHAVRLGRNAFKMKLAQCKIFKV